MAAKVSLVWKISLLYLIVFLLSILLISFYSFKSFQNETFLQIEESLGKTALNWKTHIESSIEQISEILDSKQLSDNKNLVLGEDKTILKNNFIESIKTRISKELIGKTGYIWILNSNGDYIVSKNRSRDGENIWKAKDSSGRLFIQEIIKEGKKHIDNYYVYYYPWKNLDEKKARMKIAGIIYFPDLDWYLGASAYHDEFLSGLNKTKEKIFIISFVLSFIGISIFILFMISIKSSLGKIANQANKIGEGCLQKVVDKKYIKRRDEIGLLARSQYEMLEKLSDIVSLVINGSEQVAVASSQLSAGNHDLSKRTEQQAAAIELLFSDIKRISESIKENSKDTEFANTISKNALGKSGEVEASVNRMITLVNEIHEYSKKITNIIKLITEIVSQTNILAINASIEASHAGEMGKGFAVVAKEVRDLAERSRAALSQILDIISMTNMKIDESVGVVGTTGSLLSEIKGSVLKLDDLISGISIKSREDLNRAEEIEESLNHIDTNTEKNVALVEEAAVATEELSEQAQALSKSMSFFKVEN